MTFPHALAQPMADRIQGDSFGNRYLALIDILGFKAIVEKGNFGLLAALLKRFQAEMRQHAREGGPEEQGSGPLFFLIFSDSLLIYSEEENLWGLRDVLAATQYAIVALLRTGFPARGAVTRGELFVSGDRHVFFGKGLVRAYELEQGQKWVGAILDPELPGGDLEAKYAIDRAFAFGTLRSYPVPWGPNPIRRVHATINWAHLRPDLDANHFREDLRRLDEKPAEDGLAKQDQGVAYLESWAAKGRQNEDAAFRARECLAFLNGPGRETKEPGGIRTLLLEMAARAASVP
ncbi:MAG: hypothetical protein ACYDBQ_05885 [Thermoplasmatota archaeon]